MTDAQGKVVAILYHNGCPSAESAFDQMKMEYNNVCLYKVNTLNAEDIKNKYADGGSKPYFKFYRNSTMVEEVKYQSNWNNHEPVVRAALAKHNE